MQQDTKNKFAAILAAAQAKEAAKQQPTAQPQAPATATAAKIKPAAQPEVKEYTNLQDIEAAAKNGETISILNLHNLVNAKPAPTPATTPELSTMTSAELLGQTAAPAMCTPIAFELPAIQTQPEPAPQEKPARKIQIIDYSEKAIAVIGETKEIRHILKSLGGKYNSFLSCGKGWIFSKKQLDNVKTELLKLQ